MPERPFDCSDCRRPIHVCYTEIVDGKMTRTIMCGECPHLEKKLYGGKTENLEAKESLSGSTLVCANCNTTLEEVRMGSPLGCTACYDVFQDVLIVDLQKSGRVSHHLATSNKSTSLHIGRAPGEAAEVSPTLRLIALNEALDEMLVREDYEQAALLRDQIKALKGKDDRKK